jgi:hypothetical protein
MPLIVDGNGMPTFSKTNIMSLITRPKKILLNPREEWPVISGETATIGSLLTAYVIPLALIPSLATLLRDLL